MRPKDQEAVYGGVPLSGLRGLSPEFFDEYHIEDSTSFVPDSLLREAGVSYQHAIEEQLQLDLPYRSETQKTVKLGNDTLPVYGYRDEITRTVRDNIFTIISAETGAGKSTQVSQFLLEAGWNTVYQTQPRRPAAHNVHERVQSELVAKLGEGAQELVSCQTAEGIVGSREAKIKVVTDGLQLARDMHNSTTKEDKVIIIDEVHEWNSNIEVLVAWSKKQAAENPNLRFIFMSATMDANNLRDYLGDVTPTPPPIIEIPGRLHDIEKAEEPDSNVVNETIKAAEKLYTDGDLASNGILVFMPGKREINDAIDEIRRRLPSHIANVATILPLHAKLSPKERQEAINPHAGIKIIVSTEVAQTSLTIPDIKYVIDSGLQRRMELDHEGVQGLILHEISRADCDQRAGRAGRVTDGFYILTKLDDKTLFTPYSNRQEFPTPEILRTDIVRNTLRVAGVGLDITDLDMFHPVDLIHTVRAQSILRTLGALDENGDITKLGERMNEFPLGVISAHMMVEASRYSEQTRAYMSAMVASREVGGLPYFAYNVGKRWHELTEDTTSDLLAQLDIFIATQGMTKQEMIEHDLDLQNIDRARELYLKIAKQAGVLDAEYTQILPPTLQEREDLKRCIYASSITSMYEHKGGGKYTHIGELDSKREISKRSVVTGKPSVAIGTAYRVVVNTSEGQVERHIIENVTSATLAAIGEAAASLTEWRADDYAMRDGKFVQREKHFLGDLDLETFREVEAQPSQKLRQTIIAHVIENPGNQQIKLRKLKKDLERLDRIAKDPVQQLTHDNLIKLVEEATPDNVTDPSVVDNNLRILIEERNMSIDSFVSSERRERIVRDAPREVESNGVTLRVLYQKKHPVVGKYTREAIARLGSDIYLADGRQIRFLFEGKKISLLELREKLDINHSVIA